MRTRGWVRIYESRVKKVKNKKLGGIKRNIRLAPDSLFLAFRDSLFVCFTRGLSHNTPLSGSTSSPSLSLDPSMASVVESGWQVLTSILL